MSQAVVCLVNNTSQAASVIEALNTANFPNSDVSLLMPDNARSQSVGIEKHSKAPEGAATGAAGGMALGGALGWLAGAGAIAIPGVGPFIAAGPLLAALGGAAVGGAVGGAGGGLVGLGIPEYEAKQYEGKLANGQILISVHTEDKDDAKRVEKIFKDLDAADVNCVTEQCDKKSCGN